MHKLTQLSQSVALLQQQTSPAVRLALWFPPCSTRHLPRGADAV